MIAGRDNWQNPSSRWRADACRPKCRPEPGPREGLPPLAALQSREGLCLPPQVNGPLCLRAERQIDPPTLRSGGIGGKDRLQHGPAILTGAERLLVLTDAVHEMPDLSVEAV